MPNIKGLIQDPSYKKLSNSERREVLSKIDPAFQNLEDQEIQDFSSRFQTTPKPEALSSLEQMLGGQMIDPITGERSPQQIQSALQEVRGRSAQIQSDLDRQQGLQALGAPGSLAAGIASVPQGIGELVKLALVRSGLGTEGQFNRMFPEQRVMGESISEMASVNPLAASLGSAVMNAATMGRAGGVPLNLARSAGALSRGESALASELAKQAAIEGGVGAGANVGIGQGLRTLTGGETTSENVLTDLILGTLTAGRTPDRSPYAQDLESLITQRSQQALPVGTDIGAGQGALVNVTDTPSLVSRAVQPIRNVVSRTRINLAEASSQRQAVRDLAKEASDLVVSSTEAGVLKDPALPRLTEQAVINAGDNGILPRDIQLFTTSNIPEKKDLLKMATQAKAYSENRMSTDPALLVGNGFTKIIRPLESIKEKLGQDLGNLVKDLPLENISDPNAAVVNRLQAVPGLSGIKLKEDGSLDFSDTTLSGSLTKSDRSELQSVFNDVPGRSPLQIHRMRQEIFEVLGGKKSAKIQMTDTLDKALEAVRQGLADVLEDVSPEYRIANQNYAQALQPLRDIRRFFKNVEGAGDDILDQKGAILGRRLTSNMQSAPELRDIISNMEAQIIKNGGKVDVNITRLQEFYNALSRYYDLAKDTGLAGQVKLGTGEIPTTLRGAALKKAKELSGTTSAVQRKYLEDLISTLSKTVPE